MDDQVLRKEFHMKYRLLSFVLLLSMLNGFAACANNEETADVPPSSPETETAVQSSNSTPPAGAEQNAAAVSSPEPAANAVTVEEEPPALSEADYIASAEEILTAVLGENAPKAETPDMTETFDAISERPEIELTFPVGDSQAAITFDKESGRLRRLNSSFDGLIKPAQYTDPESAAREWYAALSLPQDYVLRSVVPYGDDWLCHEFNRRVTLETGDGPVEVFSSYEAVRIMILRDTGALVSVVVFHWPLFEGDSQKTAVSEAEAVEIAEQSRSGSGEETVTSQIVLYHPYDPVFTSRCSPEQSVNYTFPVWEVVFSWKNDGFDCEDRIHVDLYTGEIMRRHGAQGSVA